MAIDFDEVNEWLEENEAPDNIREAFKSSKLRAVIAEKEAEIARLKPFEAQVTKLEKAPKLAEAFKQVGVDFDSLPKYAKAIVENFDGDLADADAVSAYASEWELPTSEVAESSEAPAAAAVVAHAQAPRVTSKPQSVDDQIAEAENQMRDPGLTLEQRQQAAANARALKLSKVKPEGLTATSA